MTERRKTAIYLRISTEDYTARTAYRGQEESFSISHQREFLLDYIKKDKMLEDNDVLEFCDDGFTGTNMERPGMQEMLKAVRQNRIGCILVKDDCVIKARTPQTLENRHFLRIGTEFRAIQRPQRAAYHIETS